MKDFYQYTSIFEGKQKKENRCVIRLQTNIWSDKRGLHCKKSLCILKRKCKGFNILEEDTSNIGADDVLPKIINIDECKDGIYEVVTCNESRDYETGYIDDYDYRLIPYNSK